MAQLTPSDDDLILAAVPGSEAAWREIVGRYWPRLIGFLRCKRVHESNLEDMAQDVLIKVFRALPKRKPGNFAAWLLAIAGNHIKDGYKKPRLPMAEGDEVILLQADLRAEPDPDFADKLNDCIQNLKPNFREAVIGHAHGSSYEELAEELKIPIDTVKSRIFRGRADLKQCLGPYAE